MANPRQINDSDIFPTTTSVCTSGNSLVIGGCSVPELAKTFGTPLYLVDEETIRESCRRYKKALHAYEPEARIAYACKAWSAIGILSIIADEGLSFDVVSGGELYTLMRVIGPDGPYPKTEEWIRNNVFFHGNNKSTDELRLSQEVGCTVIVDNWLEFDNLRSVSSGKIPILVRMTPGIECHTHRYVRTGQYNSKFGFDGRNLNKVLNYLKNDNTFDFRGFHAHIGSQIFETDPHVDLVGGMISWIKRAHGFGLHPSIIDIGGGLGVKYVHSDDPPSIENWCCRVKDAISTGCAKYNVPQPILVIEPGRSVIARSTATVYTVGSRKETFHLKDERSKSQVFVAVDGGMTDNMRPMLYGAKYTAIVANRMGEPLISEDVAIVGKYCEEGDVLIPKIKLPETKPGDILVIPATGAYSECMASNYNRQPRPAVVVVENGKSRLIVRRETYDDLLRNESL